MAEGPPPTVHGHPPHEIVSWLQKAIRRGDTDAAIYCALELSTSGFGPWLWKRLRVICSEDCAVDPHLPATVEALHGRALDFRKGKGGEEHMVAVHAAVLLAESKKSRLACWATVAWAAMEKREVPDYALDRHTRVGRRLARGWDHFWDEASRLENHLPRELEATYRALARAAVEHPQPTGGPGQGALFEE
jgi:replication-associated recombination protein RarA